LQLALQRLPQLTNELLIGIIVQQQALIEQLRKEIDWLKLQLHGKHKPDIQGRRTLVFGRVEGYEVLRPQMRPDCGGEQFLKQAFISATATRQFERPIEVFEYYHYICHAVWSTGECATTTRCRFRRGFKYFVTKAEY